MTTTDPGFVPPAAPQPAPPGPPRLLRRSRTDRVGAGVAGGLGEYFGVDPILFRVLFATAAFFGGAGVLAYLLAWFAIPESGAAGAPIDRFVEELKRRHFPGWLAAAAVLLAVWAIGFSWWSPGRFFPGWLVVVAVLLFVFGRRGRWGRRGGWEPHAATTAEQMPPGAAPTVTLRKDDPAAAPPPWVQSTREWVDSAREAARERRRRAWPVRVTVLSLLAIALCTIGIVDALVGVPLPVYCWTVLGIVVLGLATGAVLRRAPWSIAMLLVPAVAGVVAFGNSSAQLHDGFGQRVYTPADAAELHGAYRLAFGQLVLDLRRIPTLSTAQTVDITVAGGQVQLLLPPSLNAGVHTVVHVGVVEVNGPADGDADRVRSHGAGIDRTVLAPTGTTGAPLTITVHLADGEVWVDRR